MRSSSRRPKFPSGTPLDETEQAARNSQWTTSLQPCNVSNVGGRSGGVGIAVKSHVGLAKPTVVTDGVAGLEPARFGLRRIGAVCPGGLHAGSCYLTSAVGIAAPCNLRLLEAIAFALAQLEGPWLLAGDWNCSPQDLTDTGWLQLVGGGRGPHLPHL